LTLKKTTAGQAGSANCVKVLGYSEAGNGKTRLCGTAPGPLIISAEAGLLSLKKEFPNTPAWEIETVEDLNQAYQDVQRERNVYTVCLDSITEIAERILANAKKQVKDPRQAYGEVLEKTTMVIRAYRDLPNFNVYMTAKCEPLKDEMSGAVKWGPMMPGSKLGPALPYYFDEVFYLGVGKDAQGNKFRYLQTQPSLTHHAKDRSGRLAEFEPPDLTHVFKKVLGYT
jgi:hypothetical protein